MIMVWMLFNGEWVGNWVWEEVGATVAVTGSLKDSKEKKEVKEIKMMFTVMFNNYWAKGFGDSIRFVQLSSTEQIRNGMYQFGFLKLRNNSIAIIAMKSDLSYL